MIKQMLEILSEPDKAHTLGATKILVALIKTSPATAPFTIAQTLPQLLRDFNRPKLPSHRPMLLNMLSVLLIAAGATYGASTLSTSHRDYAKERSLDTFQESILDVLREGLRTSGLKEPAVRASVAVIEVTGFLSSQEVDDLARRINPLLLDEETVTDPGIRYARHSLARDVAEWQICGPQGADHRFLDSCTARRDDHTPVTLSRHS